MFSRLYFFMKLQRLANNLNKLDLVDLSVKVFESMEEFIADLNRKQMAKKGLRSDGTELEPDYSSFTVDYKLDEGQGTGKIVDHVTLFDTGTMHKSIFAEIFPDEIVLDSNDPKISDLEDKYGEFLGLTDESIEIVRKEFLKRFTPLFYEAILG